MTAAQLIAALQAYPPETVVLYDNGPQYNVVENVTPGPGRSNTALLT